MTIRIQIINDTIPALARQRIRRRINKLTTFYEKIISASAVLKKDSNSNEKGCHCEIGLSVKGYDLFAKSKAANFEAAASEAIESLRKKIRKRKTSIKAARRKL